MTNKTFRTSLIHSISILTIFLVTSNSTSALDLWTNECPNTTMFDNNSDYAANLNTLLYYLATNATNPSGYHQSTVNDEVYGHFLCRTYLGTSTCQDCVTAAITQGIPTKCPNRKVAILWYNDCLVRYSDQSFFGIMNEHPWSLLSNPINVLGNEVQFMKLREHMNNVIAVQAAIGGENKFSTYSVNFTTNKTIYGMGLCTPDLRPGDCMACLANKLSKFGASVGARAIQPSCFIQYEMSPFFDLSLLAPPPLSPPLLPGSRGTSTSLSKYGLIV
ncbi:unnamed protein product [Amaranthus hypochondriacus]